MPKLATVDAYVKVFENVPVPLVQQVATVTDMILTLVEQEHDVNLSAEKTAIATLAAEITAAREPWQSIHDRASAAQLGVVTGSTGE